MKNSKIIQLKSKFFFHRAIIYGFFILLSVWIPRNIKLSVPVEFFIIILYILFMAGQWFLLGKEIDHRLKIYFRVNSSLDRLVYRLLLGKIAFVIYFQLLSFFPDQWQVTCFWGTWCVLGIFYSWPTRGKIIEETASRQLGEFKFLDPFERTILALTVTMLMVSTPTLPPFESMEALKLFFDPLEKFAPPFWNYLSLNYIPFKAYHHLYRMSWFLHFYFVGIGLFLLSFYALLRFFVSRRLSLLGIFALISSWSFVKIIGNNVGLAISSTFSLIWVWGLFWSTKSSTYRAGLFVGLLGLWGTLINQFYFFLLPLQLALLYFFTLQNKTFWFKRQMMKYALLGTILAVLTFLMREGPLQATGSWQTSQLQLLDEVFKVFNRKAFNSLSVVGIILFILLIFQEKLTFLRPLHMEKNRLYEFSISLLALILFTIIFSSHLDKDFTMMWPITFFALIPLEWIFQTLSRVRSRRNLIYLLYILICLLDSHFEGRVKILVKFLSGD